ncbi:hypothetical protein Bca101_080656 [Brassica carinata]
MTYTPPLSVTLSAPQSPNLSGGLRSEPSFLVEQENCITQGIKEVIIELERDRSEGNIGEKCGEKRSKSTQDSKQR